MLLNKATNPLADCQLKFDNGKEGVFEGYASVWGRVDSYGDTVVKGAFEKTIAQHKESSRMPLMLFGHSPGRVIGKWQVMSEDDYGLRVVGELTPGHTDAANIKASMEHGAISGLSIGFRLPPNGSEEKDDGRILKEIDLVEISVVSMPAEDAARIDQVRSDIESLETIRDAELWLRDAAAFSRAQAKAFIATMRDIHQRDADAEAKAKQEALDAEAVKTEQGQWLKQILNNHFGG